MSDDLEHPLDPAAEAEVTDWLRRSTPVMPRIDPSCIAFEAGRRAGLRGTRRWRCAASLAAIVAVAALVHVDVGTGTRDVRPTSTDVRAIAHDSGPAAPRGPTVWTATRAAVVNRPRVIDKPRTDGRIDERALALRERVIEHGLHGLPRRPPRSDRDRLGKHRWPSLVS